MSLPNWRNNTLLDEFRRLIGLTSRNLKNNWERDPVNYDADMRMMEFRPLLLSALAVVLTGSMAYTDDELVSCCKRVLDGMSLEMGEHDITRLVVQIRAQVEECGRDPGELELFAERDWGGIMQESHRQLRRRTQTVKDWSSETAFVFGIHELDSLTQGVQPGEIMILNGSQGSMKTSLVLSGVENALSRKMSVQFFSLDMHMGELQERRLQRRLECSQRRLHEMIREGDPAVAAAEDDIYQADNKRFHLCGNVGSHCWTVKELVRDVKIKMPHVLVIDYLTLLRRPEQSDLDCANEAMPTLKGLAHECGVRIIILSQMSRSAKRDQQGGAIGGHAKGGGIIEELAHSEIELFKDIDPDGDRGKIIATISKNRRGPSGRSFELEYKPECMTFTGYASRVQRTGRAANKPLFEPLQAPQEWGTALAYRDD